jgi:hypothetical protein
VFLSCEPGLRRPAATPSLRSSSPRTLEFLRLCRHSRDDASPHRGPSPGARRPRQYSHLRRSGRQLERRELMSDFRVRRPGLLNPSWLIFLGQARQILASISSISLKRGHWSGIQLFGNSEQLPQTAKTSAKGLVRYFGWYSNKSPVCEIRPSWPPPALQPKTYRLL